MRSYPDRLLLATFTESVILADDDYPWQLQRVNATAEEL